MNLQCEYGIWSPCHWGTRAHTEMFVFPFMRSSFPPPPFSNSLSRGGDWMSVHLKLGADTNWQTRKCSRSDCRGGNRAEAVLGGGLEGQLCCAAGWAHLLPAASRAMAAVAAVAAVAGGAPPLLCPSGSAAGSESDRNFLRFIFNWHFVWPKSTSCIPMFRGSVWRKFYLKCQGRLPSGGLGSLQADSEGWW